MRSIRRSMAAGLLGAAALGLWAPAHAVAGTGAGGVDAAQPSVTYCGPDQATGLAVSADRTVSCATALQVAGAYNEAASGARDASATVRVGVTAWKCQERQGDPNPYRECVDASDSGRRVILSS
ncbi:hypothetical protein [Streptomyces cyanogenus]|uniref:Secreted protein n=1 Tax=Streptomyces cyanogenus TaxID=80860 RepID=A0ABX7U5L4_STRCY|nr:hypothetical protein [Streptomyces cyanogenus]QTE02841.1 hypothetical protein S1361_36245 [Streptomyces cyanogenus]